MTERKLWAIVLAGGEGSRLAETTRRLYGSSLPKQFVSFGRKRSFLQATVDRLAPTIPSDRVVVVVAAKYARLAREQLSEHRGVEIVAQPRTRGTGPGVLLPLVHVLRRDPMADVALVPSDHDFVDNAAMRSTLERAHAAVSGTTSGVVLLGAKAEAASTDLGWISTIDKGCGILAVDHFEEKPSAAVANRLYREGALWNTMLCVAHGQALWMHSQKHLPKQTEQLERYASSVGSESGEQVLRKAYDSMAEADFSRDLLGAASNLHAVSMEGAGWSDCGTPERLLQALGPVNVRRTASESRSERISGAA